MAMPRSPRDKEKKNTGSHFGEFGAEDLHDGATMNPHPGHVTFRGTGAKHTEDEGPLDLGTLAFEHEVDPSEPPQFLGMASEAPIRPVGYTGEAYTYGQKRGTMPKSPKSLQQARDREAFENYDDDDDAEKLACDVLDDDDTHDDEHHPMSLHGDEHHKGDDDDAHADDGDLMSVADDDDDEEHRDAGMDPPSGDLATQLQKQQAHTAVSLTGQELYEGPQAKPSDPSVTLNRGGLSGSGISKGAVRDVPVPGWK